MAIQAGTRKLGPHNGTLQVKTYRQGMASKAGHDLVMDVQRWEGSLSLDEDGEASVELSADPRSFDVREGLHGVKPLSDKDRGDIVKNIDEKVLGGQPIEFRSTAVQVDGEGDKLSISGELTLVGRTRPVSFELEAGPNGQLAGAASLVPSEWGIKPYSAMMGALKVRDSVDIALDARLS